MQRQPERSEMTVGKPKLPLPDTVHAPSGEIEAIAVAPSR